MKLIVLVDNNTFIDKYYYGEPAVSYYIEDEDKRILFDAGYSDLFIKNAEALQRDLNDLTDIVISHGHNDHTGSFTPFFEYFNIPGTRITAHPKAFNKKSYEGAQIGSPLSAEQLREKAELILSDKPMKISKNTFFLGEIPSLFDFEERKPIGKEIADGRLIDDFLLDDSAVAYKSEKGVYIITGCSHSGICNIIEYSKKVCGDERIAGVIGGFHLFNIDERTEKTVDYFVKNNIIELYPCHCVSFKVKAEIDKRITVQEVGVSMELAW